MTNPLDDEEEEEENDYLFWSVTGVRRSVRCDRNESVLIRLRQDENNWCRSHLTDTVNRKTMLDYQYDRHKVSNVVVVEIWPNPEAWNLNELMFVYK